MKIIIKNEEWNKLIYFVERARGEVGGFGFADRDENNDIVISKILLTKQIATTAHVDHDEEGLNDFALEHADNIERIRLQWHSHGTLGAFFSTTDVDNINGLIKTGIQWLASIVITKDLETEARVDIGDPFRVSIAKVDIEVESEPIEPEPEWRTEYNEKVTEPETVIATINDGGYHGGRFVEPYDYRDDDVYQPSLLSGKTCASCFREIDGIKFWNSQIGAYICDTCHRSGRTFSPDAITQSSKCGACDLPYRIDEIPQRRKDLDSNDTLICDRCCEEWDELIAEEEADNIDQAIMDTNKKSKKAIPAI